MTHLLDLDASCLRPCAFFSDVVHTSPFVYFSFFSLSQTLLSVDPGPLQQAAQAIDLEYEISFRGLVSIAVVHHCCQIEAALPIRCL